VSRLVAVLGFSTRRGDGLHPICAERLAAAQRAAEGADAVVLSGWSRRTHRPSEAELMRAAWRGPDVPLVVDGDARTTVGNVRAVARAARELGAAEVVVVTSSWHARRARLLARAALPAGVVLEVATPAPTRPRRLVARELLCLPSAMIRASWPTRSSARRRSSTASPPPSSPPPATPARRS
jgi:uncharacterized SAM-binding protein YcdF (DUF218 family)